MLVQSGAQILKKSWKLEVLVQSGAQHRPLIVEAAKATHAHTHEAVRTPLLLLSEHLGANNALHFAQFTIDMQKNTTFKEKCIISHAHIAQKNYHLQTERGHSPFS